MRSAVDVPAATDERRGQLALLVVMAVVFAETGLLTGFFPPGDSLLFTTGLLTAGFFLGGVPLIADHVELLAVGMVALSLIPAVVAIVRHRIHARHARAVSAAALVPALHEELVS